MLFNSNEVCHLALQISSRKETYCPLLTKMKKLPPQVVQFCYEKGVEKLMI
jgi:hypothetical protein